MKDMRDAGWVVCRKGVLQDCGGTQGRREFKRGGMKERRDAGNQGSGNEGK